MYSSSRKNSSLGHGLLKLSSDSPKERPSLEDDHSNSKIISENLKNKLKEHVENTHKSESIEKKTTGTPDINIKTAFFNLKNLPKLRTAKEKLGKLHYKSERLKGGK